MPPFYPNAWRPILLLSILGACNALSIHAAPDVDPYDVLETLLPKDQLPRVLNSEDIPNLRPTDPQPLFTPEGDFTGDGREDIVISGVYGLPTNPSRRFFLLAAGPASGASGFQKYFFEEYDRPVFIHRPGTTGEGDPGDQAFSVSLCYDCEQGLDFYWNKKSSSFQRKTWKSRTRHTHRVVTEPAVQVSSETADKALKIVSQLKDIQDYVASLKKKGKDFGVRIDPPKEPDIYTVRIFERKQGKEIGYDAITVDLKQERILKRKRKIKRAG